MPLVPDLSGNFPGRAGVQTGVDAHNPSQNEAERSGFKITARLSVTSNKSSLSGLQNFDSVSTLPGDVVLLMGQTNGWENGVYIVSAYGWVRHPSFASWDKIPGAMVIVTEGTLRHDSAWICTNDRSGTLGVTPITFSSLPIAGVTAASISDASANGRSMLTAANYAAMKTLLGITAGDITDASANGRSILTAANYAAMKTLLAIANTDVSGLGTMSVLPVMTAAQFRANTASKGLTTDTVWGAAAEVTLTDAATIAIDFSTFINGVVTLGGARALGAPTNLKNGQSGYILVIQDATGGRTLTYNAAYKFVGGVAPTVSPTANALTYLFYTIRGATVVINAAIDVK